MPPEVEAVKKADDPGDRSKNDVGTAPGRLSVLLVEADGGGCNFQLLGVRGDLGDVVLS